MAEVLLFHHAQGQTDGFLAFAQTLRSNAHTVHTPDLYDGQVFARLEDGVAHANQLGMGQIIERGVAAAADLPHALVYAGFSLGVLPAQKLAQTRAGARAALLMHACVPITMFASHWPTQVPVQVHGMQSDPFFAAEGDLEAARALVACTAQSQLFVYPGREHLFADASLPSYDASATALLLQRVLGFLAAA